MKAKPIIIIAQLGTVCVAQMDVIQISPDEFVKTIRENVTTAAEVRALLREDLHEGTLQGWGVDVNAAYAALCNRMCPTKTLDPIPVFWWHKGGEWMTWVPEKETT